MLHSAATFSRTQYFLAILSLALALLADRLFFGHPFGVSLAVFALALLAMAALRFGVGHGSLVSRLALGALAGLILALAKEPRPLAVMLSCAALGTFIIARQSSRLYTLRAWLGRWIFLLLELAFRFPMDQLRAMKWFARHPRLFPRWLRLVCLWIVPAILGGVFLLLFVAGNPIIAEAASRIAHRAWEILRTIPEWLSASRVFLWILIAGGSWGLLRASRRHRPAPVVVPPMVYPQAAAEELPLVLRCLTVFNLVFGIETVVDIVYLWGGAALPEGITYTSYAHRAAYPLVAAALLAAGFVLLVFRQNGPGIRSPWARRLVYLWLVQNALLTWSTIWRLKLYVFMYGLTWLRVSTAVWAGLIVAGMAWIVVKIALRRSNSWLVRANLATLAAVLYVSAFVNWEGFIAEFNIRHCSEVTQTGGELDVGYLEALGPSALPALIEIRPALSKEKARETAGAIERLSGELNEKMADWRGWTLDRQAAARAIPPRGVTRR